VARQLADIAQIAPGRLTFGVGIGGEDRHEVSSCGIDPATRGLRMNECLAIVRELLTGKPVTYHGTFFDLDEVVIAPAPAEAIPIVVGGRLARPTTSPSFWHRTPPRAARLSTSSRNPLTRKRPSPAWQP
jgi:alkanesulfonate monooxygenase SsuD/methylene tetrahydromethanopterin reductase-like flavin-dependent oxidoreductase (luciferase family)